MSIAKLLGYGTKKNTVYQCEFCHKNWTDGNKAFGGFIACDECLEHPEQLLVRTRGNVFAIEQEIFGK